MRQITVKYNGECARCAAPLNVGDQAMYEKRTGIFCVGCEPTEVEDIRKFRLAKAEHKAERYEEWAEKREKRATAQLNSYPEIRHDWAFITQPGHIPFRARMIKADDRAYESLHKAKEMRQKADNLRNVRVAGDAERHREGKREQTREWITKGMLVDTVVYGHGRVLRINKKTATIGSCGTSGTLRTTVDLSWLRPVKEEPQS